MEAQTMANYDSSSYPAQAAGQSPVPGHGLGASVKVARASVAVDTSLAANDLLRFFYLPPGARVIDVALRTTDLDSNGSPTIKLDVGDAGDTDRLIAASSIGQTGGSERSLAPTGWGYQYAARTLISATVNTAAATKAAGTVELMVVYVVDGLAS
jgi:hypothetical protein